jgi:hypothetical protein
MKRREKIFLNLTVVATIIAALALAISAATFSVTGLSKTFAGSAESIIIMGSALEFSKIVCAVYIHFFWHTMKSWMRVWLTTSLFVLVVLTSMGIYGFLSSSYKITETKYNATLQEVEFIEFEKEAFNDRISQLNSLIDQNNNQIEYQNNLKQGMTTAVSSSSDYYEYIDPESGEKVRRPISSNRNALLGQINQADNLITDLRDENNEVRDSISTLRDSVLQKNKLILKTELENESAGELGPLIYISEITGSPMAKVVNIFILVLVVVFDPLAILLVFAAISAFKAPASDVSDDISEDDYTSLDEYKIEPEPSVSLTPQDYRDIVDKYHEKTKREPKKRKKKPTPPPIKKNKLKPKKKT